MKKMILAALLVAGSLMSANAGSIEFMNFTNCSFNFNIDGAIGTTGSFVCNGVIIPPGNTLYADPTLVPNVHQFGTGTLSTGLFQVVKGYDVGGPYSFVIGNILSLPTMYNSGSNAYFPACYNFNAYTATFSTNGSGNVVVLIF